MSSRRSTVSMEACFGFGNRPAELIPIDKSVVDMAIILSHGPSHLACMYFCFLHGPICIFFSFMHFLAAKHNILIRPCSLSTFPTNTSGSLWTSLLYSWLALAISNSALKLSSIITLTSPDLLDDDGDDDLEFSTTSKNVCSPVPN